MLKKYLLISLLFATSAYSEGNIPSDVEDVINSFNNKAVPSGLARHDLIESNKEKHDRLSDAKFNFDIKVVSCQEEKLPEFLKDENLEHDACGEMDAKIIFEDNVDLVLTRESKLNNFKTSKIIRTIPQIAKEGDNYTIKDEQIINKVNLGVELFVVPTTIVENKVQLDIAVRTTELADIDEVFLDSNNRSFVNSDIALKHRFLVASFPVSLNEVETLGGNSATLLPIKDDFKASSGYPESSRLWLDVKLSIPKRD